jgi:hypothetical protein
MMIIVIGSRREVERQTPICEACEQFWVHSHSRIVHSPEERGWESSNDWKGSSKKKQESLKVFSRVSSNPHFDGHHSLDQMEENNTGRLIPRTMVLWELSHKHVTWIRQNKLILPCTVFVIREVKPFLEGSRVWHDVQRDSPFSLLWGIRLLVQHSMNCTKFHWR